jgi:hypothetical protein
MPPALAREAGSRGCCLSIDAFPAQAFADRFFASGRSGSAPDVLVFDNFGTMDGIVTKLGTFVGIAQDPVIRNQLIQVTGSFDELLGPARGWTFLFTSSANYAAARELALRTSFASCRGAKALFYDSVTGQATPASPSPVTGLTPVQTLGTAFVGVHYWFENDHGVKFADPANAGLGARLRMHLRGNTSAFLTVWMSNSTHKSLELTTRSDAGPNGRWTGYLLARDLDYVVNGDFEVAPAERATRIIFLLARSQTEQVDSFSGCQEKLQRIASRTASDGEPALVREVDRATPGQLGTYVVNRSGAQAGDEFAIATTHGGDR